MSLFDSSEAQDGNDIDRDAELARLLQMQENQRAAALARDAQARTAHYQRENMEEYGGLNPGGDGGVADASTIRMNIFNDARAYRNRKLDYYVAWFFRFPQIVAMIVVLSQHWNEHECDQPLKGWTVAYGTRMLFVFARAIACYFNPDPDGWAVRFERRFSNLFSFLGMALFIMGNMFFFSSKTCKSLEPEIYTLVLALLCIYYFVLLFPFVLCLCLLPMVYFCMPCVIRLLTLLEEPSQGRGASDEQILNLPVTIYHLGVIASSPGSPPSCVICTEEYKDGDECRVLPCHPTHHFHKECVDDWLRINATCPHCRQSVVATTDDSKHNDDGDFPDLEAGNGSGYTDLPQADDSDDTSNDLEDIRLNTRNSSHVQ